MAGRAGAKGPEATGPSRVLVGVDLVDVARMERALERTPSLKRRLFTAGERLYSDRRAHPAQSYAARFAAREAVLKALGTGFSGMGLKDVSVALDDAGRPKVVLAGAAKARADELGVVEVALSLSHTSEVACANAVLITEGARPRRERADDQAARLASSFKEARSIVLELEGALAAEAAERERAEAVKRMNVALPFPSE